MYCIITLKEIVFPAVGSDMVPRALSFSITFSRVPRGTMFLNIWEDDIRLIREGYFISKINWSTWLVYVFYYTLSLSLSLVNMGC